MKKNELLLLAFVLMLSSAVSAEEMAAPVAAASAAPVESVPKSGIEILKLVFCKSIQDRQPVEELTAAQAGDVVAAWMQVRSGLGDVTLTHRWLHEGKTVSDVPLPITSSPFRTWSRKTLFESGTWTLQVLNPAGEVLKEISLQAEK